MRKADINPVAALRSWIADNPMGWATVTPRQVQAVIEAVDAIQAVVAGSGVALIAAERARQVAEEGWTAAHDDAHAGGELAQAAACYAWSSVVAPGEPFSSALLDLWPWDYASWKPKGRTADLVRAGALIAAELNRVARKAAEAAREAK